MESNKNIFHKKPDNEFEEKLQEMVEGSFEIPGQTPKTPEERQAKWDDLKAKQSKKFDPKNLEQGDLF